MATVVARFEVDTVAVLPCPELDGPALRRAFQALGRGPLDAALAETGLSWDDFAAVCVHQVTVPYLRTFTEGLFTTWDDDWAHWLGDAVRGIESTSR